MSERLERFSWKSLFRLGIYILGWVYSGIMLFKVNMKDGMRFFEFIFSMELNYLESLRR